MSRRKPISQREARELRKRVAELERRDEVRTSRYCSEYPGGTHIGTMESGAPTHAFSAVYTAQLLGHAVVVRADGKQRFQLYAVHP